MINIRSFEKKFDNFFDEQKFIDLRFNNVKTFFKKRNLSFENAFELVKDYYSEGDILLLTSSPVYGFATDKSDIDFILVKSKTDDEISSRTPLTMYEGTTRFDIYRFNQSEISLILEKFDLICSYDVNEILNSFSNWDSIFPSISSKIFERLINSITFDSKMPYITQLKKLSYVWMLESYYRNLRFNTYANISIKCNMQFGTLGYMLNGVLNLMTSLMSYHGHVYSNKKHQLIGWKAFVEYSGTEETGSLLISVDECFKLITDCLNDCQSQKVNNCLYKLNEIQNAVADYIDVDFIKKIKIQKTSDYRVYTMLKDLYVIDGNNTRFLSKNNTSSVFGDCILFSEMNDEILSYANELLTYLKAGIYKITL